MEGNALITAIFAVFTAIGEWFADAITALLPIFYTEAAGLTFIGTMSVVGLGIGIILMVLAIIRSYIQLRA